MDTVLLFISTLAAAVAAVAGWRAVRDARSFHAEERSSSEVERLLAVHAVVAEIQELVGEKLQRGVRGLHVQAAVARRRLVAVLAATPAMLPACRTLARLDVVDLDETILVACEDALDELHTSIEARSR